MNPYTDNALKHLESFILLPDMVLIKQFPLGRWGIGFIVEKKFKSEFCPKCARETTSVHDARRAKIKDATIRGKGVTLFVIKKRYRCIPCGIIFTEHFPGIAPRKRHTKRYDREVKWASGTFSDMKQVERHVRSSPATVFKARNDELKKKAKETTSPLPEVIGIDEHSIRKPKYQATQFATMVVDHTNKKVYDLVDSRQKGELVAHFSSYRGRENVKWVSMDMSSTFKGVVRESFPNAKIVVDRFHVQRSFGRVVNRMRKKATGDKRKNPVRKLLLRNDSDLKPYERRVLRLWLNGNPEVREVYEYKEAMRRVYRSKGLAKARTVFSNLMIKMKGSKNELVKTLRKTIFTWREEILNYHLKRISNGRAEGFNRKCKLIQRRAYGLRNFQNYRLVVLNTCR